MSLIKGGFITTLMLTSILPTYAEKLVPDLALIRGSNIIIEDTFIGRDSNDIVEAKQQKTKPFNKQNEFQENNIREAGIVFETALNEAKLSGRVARSKHQPQISALAAFTVASKLHKNIAHQATSSGATLTQVASFSAYQVKKKVQPIPSKEVARRAAVALGAVLKEHKKDIAEKNELREEMQVAPNSIRAKYNHQPQFKKLLKVATRETHSKTASDVEAILNESIKEQEMKKAAIKQVAKAQVHKKKPFANKKISKVDGIFTAKIALYKPEQSSKEKIS